MQIDCDISHQLCWLFEAACYGYYRYFVHVSLISPISVDEQLMNTERLKRNNNYLPWELEISFEFLMGVPIKNLEGIILQLEGQEVQQLCCLNFERNHVL